MGERVVVLAGLFGFDPDVIGLARRVGIQGAAHQFVVGAGVLAGGDDSPAVVLEVQVGVEVQVADGQEHLSLPGDGEPAKIGFSGGVDGAAGIDAFNAGDVAEVGLLRCARLRARCRPSRLRTSRTFRRCSTWP